MFKLKKPCKLCPFRTDVPGYLRQSRAQEIATAIGFRGGESFFCHETTDYVEDDDGDGDLQVVPGTQHCAGAAITLTKIGEDNRAMQVYERLGKRDPLALDLDSPVFDSLEEFVNHHRSG